MREEYNIPGLNPRKKSVHKAGQKAGYLFCSVYSYQTAICRNHLLFGADCQRILNDQKRQQINICGGRK